MRLHPVAMGRTEEKFCTKTPKARRAYYGARDCRAGWKEGSRAGPNARGTRQVSCIGGGQDSRRSGGIEIMKLPPFLLGTTLLFWGWQTGFLLPGALMAIIIESSRWVKLRWEFSEDDFSRVWTFCTIALLAATVYVFTSN